MNVLPSHVCHPPHERSCQIFYIPRHCEWCWQNIQLEPEHFPLLTPEYNLSKPRCLSLTLTLTLSLTPKRNQNLNPHADLTLQESGIGPQP